MRTLRNDMMDALTRGDQEGYERKLRALGVIVNSVPMSTEEKMQILWDPGGKAYDDITDKIMQEWSKTISEGDFNKEFDMNVRIQQKREGTLNGDQ
jgi:hypothetical protein